MKQSGFLAARPFFAVILLAATMLGLALALALLTGPADAAPGPALNCDNNGRCVVPLADKRQATRRAGLPRRSAGDAKAADANGNRPSPITVPTAAGIDITVAPSFAPKMQGLIADLVARGYHPRRINCFARGGHVAGSLHYRGEACDFDQHGFGLTPRPMHHAGDLTRKWSLRDGCSFGDCGHIDSGRIGTAKAKMPWPRMVSPPLRLARQP